MKIGFGAPVSGAWATPQNLAGFAVRAEQAGYASLWSFQRLIVPAESAMEPVYRSVLDPYAALTFAAAVTSRIRLGTAVVNLPFVSPAYLAKQAASLDVLSAGRHDVGLGIGWMPEEFAATGADMARRGARTGDGISVVRESAEAAGRDPATLRIICRGVVRAGAEAQAPDGSGRLLLSGTADQIREDTAWLSERGVTELFYDLNWDPLVGAPDIDPASAAARAGELLEALAPTGA